MILLQHQCLVLLGVLAALAVAQKRQSRGSVRFSDTVDTFVAADYAEHVVEIPGYVEARQDSGSGAIPGHPGIDYPVFASVPYTGFSCALQQHPGYYADADTHCQVFHICQRGGRMDSFLCPNGTIFNQLYLVCDWWYNVDCAHARELAHPVNEAIVRDMEAADERLRREKLQDPDVYSPKSHDLMTSAMTYARGEPLTEYTPQYYPHAQFGTVQFPETYEPHSDVFNIPQYGTRYRRRSKKHTKE